MKKVNFKKVLMALTVTLTFLFLGVEHVDAQVSATTTGTAVVANKALMAPPQGSFVNVDQASLLIMDRYEEIKNQVSTPGLPQSAINALMKEAQFYTLLHEQIIAGKSVSESIVYATITINSDVYGVTQSTALTLKQGAINLLKI